MELSLLEKKEINFLDSMAPGVPHNNLMTDDLCSKTFDTEENMHLVTVPTADDNATSFRNYNGPSVSLSLTAKKSMEVIGVILTDDRTAAKGFTAADNRSVVLGTMCLENLKITLDEFRRVMCTELPCLPAAFNFLTKEGWPIHKQQESKIIASHVVRENNSVCIKKEFDKCRVGVVLGSDPIGFVFTDMNANVKQLRELIEQQLKVSQLSLENAKFLERNGWPVMPSQESALSLLDILVGQNILLQYSERLYYSPSDSIRPTSFFPQSNVISGNQIQAQPQEISDHEVVKRKKSIKFSRDAQFSLKGRNNSDKRQRTVAAKDNLIKPILLSYVRAEAAQYALDLKQDLVSLGFSVYLDVHEIKTGSDWQDNLNFAVRNCYIFVPLITPMYGKTQWTNREVKLADVLKKIIIPINFMDFWPPVYIAIQFASTQYIPWKQETDHMRESAKPSDPKYWDSVSRKRVASQIAEVFKDQYMKLPKRSTSNKEIVTTANKPMLAPREDLYILHKDEYFDDHKQIIVISAHPRQRYIAQEIKDMFEKSGHQVWCSVEILDSQMTLGSEDLSTMDPLTPKSNLPTIQENVFFGEKETVLYSSVGEKQSSSSMYKEPEAFGRRPLSRLMSQFSDISQPSTLSREKLDHLRTFQQKVDQAGVIIVLVSEAYTKSTFSHQQVFYCEHRKRVVLVKCDITSVPKWFRLLMGNDMINKHNNPQFECALQGRVQRAINPSSSETPKDATAEAKVNYLVNFLKKNLILQEISVYITGSSKLQTKRAEEICTALGRKLAAVQKVSLVTGGFFGAADLTAKTFDDYRQQNTPSQKEEQISDVVHIIPMHDSEDLTVKARQNMDGSFETVPYGRSMFCGDSVKERETVVARLLDTCIVIEGGPGVVHEMEEFMWNDHIVIPIMSTGGAAGGQYGVPVRIFEVPAGVDATDWSVLSEKDATPEQVAQAVVNILFSLKAALASPTNTLQKPPGIMKRKSRKKGMSRKQKVQDEDMRELEIIPSTSNSAPVASMRGMFEVEISEVSQSSSEEPSPVVKRKSWWKRFIMALKHRKGT